MPLANITFVFRRTFMLLILLTAFFGLALLAPFDLKAGTGGVQGGCAFVTTVNGKTQYLTCSGSNLPMWYSANNPTYNEGDSPCGQYGNQNCGMELGSPLNE